MPAKKGSRKSKPQPNLLQQLPLFLSRAEVIGVILVFLSAITFLSLLTSSNGVLTATWLGWLEALFGVGIWGFPVVTGVVGLWMIIRAIEQMPDLPWQRPAGLVLLFLSVIMAATLWDGNVLDPLGGQVGLLLAEVVSGALGQWGAWAAASFMAVAGFVLLTERLLVEISEEVAALAQQWRERAQQEPRRTAIDPAVPLPSGMLPWWKRLQERWRGQRARLGLPPQWTSLVRPEPAPQQREPARLPQTTPQTIRVTGSAPARSESDPLTPRIIGGAQPWRLPRLDEMLRDWERHSDSDERIRNQGRLIQETLALFGVPADFEGAYKGPSVTQYLIKPGYIERTVQGQVTRTKVKVAKIAGLANDLALALAASSVRIEAPIPGTNYVGVEVPNHEGNTVGLKELMESETFQSVKGQLRIALGEDVKGQPIVADLARMPHLLIAGATGSGKSACINSIICCLLLTHTPDTLRLLMVDPKMVELSTYTGVPHLLGPVVTEVDKAAGVLFWAVKEMERRYTLFSKAGARDLPRYNDYLEKRGEKTLPYIVIIVDEMADLMMAAPEEVEKHICRLAQMARAVGIHLIIATQRPSVDVITGLIKANFPARIAFAVTSQTDSRVILDIPGAERLLGRGDMLFMAPDASKLERLQGAWTSDEEINRIIEYWKTSTGQAAVAGNTAEDLAPVDAYDLEPDADPSAFEPAEPGARSAPRYSQPTPAPLTGLSQPPLFEEIEAMRKVDARDDLFDEAVRIVEEEGRGSVNLLQRKLRIGYNRAARLVEQLEEAGILGPAESGTTGRAVLTLAAGSAPAAPLTPRIIGDDDEPAVDAGSQPTNIWM
jgi:S-DNA-T family DNA segregation ATPase FtsK/SpoIIIE